MDREDMNIRDRFDFDEIRGAVEDIIKESQRLPDCPEYEHRSTDYNDIDSFTPSGGSMLPSQEMYGEYNRLAAQKREQDARIKSQKSNKRPLVEEIFQSIPGQYDLLKDALSQKKPEIVQELFKTGQVKGLTPEEGEALLALVPKTKQWDVVKRFINGSTVRFPIVHPIRKTKPDDTPNPGEEPSGTGLKGCLEKAAQEQPSSEPQERSHAKVARARPVFKRVSGKRGPRD